MASLGDLVVNLKVNTLLFAKSMRTAGALTTRLTVKTVRLGASFTKMAGNIVGVVVPAIARQTMGFVKLAAAVTGAAFSMSRFGRVAKAVAAQSMLLISGFASLAGGAVLLGAAMGVKRLISFDDAMRATGATSRATELELSMLRETALELGRTTSFTATEVANLMTTLGRAGFDPGQIDDMTDSVLNLARATGTDATVSAGVMAASIRQFSLGALDATRVADVFTATANRTFNTVEQLGESMKFAGPIAHSLGMSLEETAAVLGVLGNVGIQGSLAGTAIRRLGAVTAAESKKMKAIFNFDFVDAAGDALPLIDMLQGIGTATENLPTAERMSKMKEAFGLLGLGSATALAGAAGDAKQLAVDLESVGGEAAATAEKMDKGVGGSFRRMMSAIDGMLISLGERLEPAFEALAEVAKNAAAFMTTGFDDVLHQVALLWVKVEVLTSNWGTAWEGLFKDIPNFAGAAFKWVEENAETMIDNVVAMISNLPAKLGNMMSGLSKEMQIGMKAAFPTAGHLFDMAEGAGAALGGGAEIKKLTEFKMPEFSKETQSVMKSMDEATALLNANRAKELAFNAAAAAPFEGPMLPGPDDVPGGGAGGGGADDLVATQNKLAPSQQRGSTEALTTILTNMQGSKKSPEVKETEKTNGILRGMAKVMARQKDRGEKLMIQEAVT